MSGSLIFAVTLVCTFSLLAEGQELEGVGVSDGRGLVGQMILACEAREKEFQRLSGRLQYDFRFWSNGQGKGATVEVERGVSVFFHDHPRFFAEIKGEWAVLSDPSGQRLRSSPVHVEISRDGGAKRVDDKVRENLALEREGSGSMYSYRDLRLPFEYVVAPTGVPLSKFLENPSIAVGRWKKVSQDGDSGRFFVAEHARDGLLRFRVIFDESKNFFPVASETLYYFDGAWRQARRLDVVATQSSEGVYYPMRATLLSRAVHEGQLLPYQEVEVRFDQLEFRPTVELPFGYRKGPQLDAVRSVGDSGNEVSFLSERERVLTEFAREGQRKADALIDRHGSDAVDVQSVGASAAQLWGREIGISLWAVTGIAVLIALRTARQKVLAWCGVAVLAICSIVLYATGSRYCRSDWQELFAKKPSSIAKLCGPECLFIVSRMSDCSLSLAALVESVGVNPRRGSLMRSLAIVAEGTSVLPASRITRPASFNEGKSWRGLEIVHLRAAHYVVVVAVEGKNCVIIDPTLGPVVVDKSLLASFSTGWSLAFSGRKSVGEPRIEVKKEKS